MARKTSALSQALMSAALAIPLTQNLSWKAIDFRSIPANKVEFLKDGLHVQVVHSAGALVRRLDKIATVTAFTADLQLNGEIPAGADWPKDSYLRLGFVLPGPRKPGFFQRMMAPEWIRELLKLAPPGLGLDKVEIYELTAKTDRLGQTREFPNSKGLMRETVAAIRNDGQSEVHFHFELPKALSAAGIWLSMDGDDTHAKFSLQLKKLELITKD